MRTYTVETATRFANQFGCRERYVNERGTQYQGVQLYFNHVERSVCGGCVSRPCITDGVGAT